jgi:uncharacterized protein involved in exopolysaccharide biosynthesis
VLSRLAVLFTLALSALGGLGGFFGAIVQPARYQAEAFVVVYDMPSGFNSLISPDEANTINAYYAAGALQDSVIQRVRHRYPAVTAAEIRQAIQVSIVAYTPLTRVTATAASPQVAVTLANAVASAWVSDAGYVITQAYNTTYAVLQNHAQQLSDQIVKTRAELEAAKPSSTKAQALNTQLQSLESQYASADANLTMLEKQRYAVAGNAYVATPASESTVTRLPDLFKSLITGAAVGFALGAVCVLWMIRVSLRAAAFRVAPPMSSPAPKSRTTMPIQQESYDN